MTLRRLILAVALATCLPLAARAQSPADSDFGRTATWQQPSEADVRAEVLKWLDEEKPAPDVRQKIEALWPAHAAADTAAPDLLERVAASIALTEPRVHELTDLCARPHADVLLPKFDWLTEDDLPVFARNNLRLLYGRWLVQNQLFDEGLVQLDGLDAKDVVDPTALFFYQGVANHQLLNKEAGLQALARLLERRGSLPKRYESLTDLMTADLDDLEDDSLDHISRRMEDIKRRLELARVGKTVRGVEDGVIESLDKLINRLEDQRQQRMASKSSGSGKGNRGTPGDPNGIRSSSPAQQSRAAQGKGAGEVAKRPIGNKSGWGDLPPKEREEALQQIGKDFPAHYREAIEQYFRRLASDGSDNSGR